LLIDAYGTIEPVDIPSVDRVLNELISSNLEINGSHFAAVITAHGCAKHDLASAMRVFDDLSTLPETVQRRAVARLPDVLAYEAILNAVVSHHRCDLMEQYWQRMQTARVRPTAYIYNILIRGYSMNGKIDEARRLFEGMSDPVAGAAAPNNHTKQPRSNDTRVYREVSYGPLYSTIYY
jgi:pentatricopeptide repeat protein